MPDIPTIKSTAGLNIYGENFFRGFASLRELLGDTDYWSLMSLAVDGRRLTDKERRYINAIAVSLLTPDPRTWLFKIPRLISSYGRGLAGLAGGQLCVLGAIIGTPVMPRSYTFFQEVARRVGDRFDDYEAVESAVRQLKEEGRFFDGYGVPLRDTDERAVWLESWYTDHGNTDSNHWAMYKHLKRAVFEVRGVRPNCAGTQAPIWAELGMNKDQMMFLSNATVLINMLCNAYDGEREHQALYRRMPESVLEYTGEPSRKSPRARAADQAE